MRIFFIIWACYILSVEVQAQKTIEKHLNFSQKDAVDLNLQITDSILIHTWNKNEVFAKASVNVDDNKDNDAYETTFTESGKSVAIKAGFSPTYFKGKKHCCETEIRWEIFMPENAALTIETINGNIVITGKTSRMKVKTISGFIDLSIPESKKADLDLKTISGDIFTDLALTYTAGKRIAELHITDKMNGGGEPIRLETISGDIFFRKTK